ncbi:acyltransferase family protein [Mucilaginibacter jinjuensis]|uniref:Acyltransferase n=1 Tax=Mucilaginibacter jinjuensis TaxID=1176721 RepID=A0ABY7TEF2_9SPHI|nr:acyltransferase [Mucilaginibacter jinjuensis]WCT14900.1 acyltransferase [Mucilaginibacter jinjuensis]
MPVPVQEIQTVPKTSNQHLLYLDSLRALAAIYVVIHHAVLHYYPSIKDLSEYQLTPTQSILFQFLKHGYYAVDLFIVLSGFSLMLSVIKNDYLIKGGYLKFIKRRIIRIIPPYYSAVLISLLLIWFFIKDKSGTQWDVCIPVSRVDIIRHILLIHDFYHSSFPRINDVLWSVAVEFRIYLFFPLLVYLWKKQGIMIALFTSVIISLAGSIALIYLSNGNTDINLTAPGVSPYIILFTTGMLAAEFSYSASDSTNYIKALYYNASFGKKILAPAIFLVLFILAKNLLKNVQSPNTDSIIKYLMDVLMGILFGFTLFFLSTTIQLNRNNHWVIKALSWKPLAWIGTFSYSLYLIHSPVLQLLSKYFLAPIEISTSTKSYLLIIIGTTSAIAIAYIFHVLFERPFMGLKNKPKIIPIISV